MIAFFSYWHSRTVTHDVQATHSCISVSTFWAMNLHSYLRHRLDINILSSADVPPVLLEFSLVCISVSSERIEWFILFFQLQIRDSSFTLFCFPFYFISLVLGPIFTSFSASKKFWPRNSRIITCTFLPFFLITKAARFPVYQTSSRSILPKYPITLLT